MPSSHHEDQAHEVPSFSAKAFGRLQVLHPISLLILIASLSISTIVLKPSLDTVARLHPTFFAPNNAWLLGYWALLLLLQVGTALSVALASGDHTKALLTNGMGPYLPLANLCVAIWAPLFVVNTRPAFIAGEAFLGAALLVLLASTLVTGVLRSYSPTWRRPVEWLLVHLPIRLFLAVLLQIDVWQQGFILFGLAESPHDLKQTIWPTFIIVVSTGVAASLWTFATTDLATGGASIFLQLALLFNRRLAEHRPTEVFAAHVLSIALIGTGLIASVAWGHINGQRAEEREGRIALPIQPHEDAAVAAAEAEAAAAEQRAAERREEAQRLREEGSEDEPTPSQLERGEGSGKSKDGPAVTRKLGHD